MRRTRALMACAAGAIVAAGIAAADGEGTATIAPAGIVVAGSVGTWTITYTAGQPGIAPGGGLRLALSGFPVRLFATPQCHDPAAPNYTTARCSNPKVPVRARVTKLLNAGWQNVETLQVTVGPPGLKAGDKIIVIYGDKSGGSPGGRVRWSEGDGLPLRIYSDTDGDGTYKPLAHFPRVTVAGGMASRLVIYAPGQAVVGQPVRVAISARDKRDALATVAPARVIIEGEGIAQPVEATFPRGGRAVAQATVVFTKPGFRRLLARVPGQAPQPVTIPASKFVSARRPNATAEPNFTPELLKAVVSATRVRAGSVLRLRTYWTNAGKKPASRHYRMFCHLERRPARGRALANWDHEPAVDTTHWEHGREIVDEYACPIPPDTPPGEHMLTVGLYRTAGPRKFINIVAYEVCRVRVGPEQPLVMDLAPALSNVVQVVDKPPRWMLLWGDIHCHSEFSGDGCADINGLYRYGRDVSRLDFCAVTDHVGLSFPADSWRKIQAAARKFNAPGRFVAFLAYEWSNMYHGDNNVYFAHDDESIRVPRSAQLEDLWPMLEGVDCVVIPHHPAYPVGLRGADWTRTNTRFVPVVEMCSLHGAAEYFGNPRPYGRNKPMGPSLPGGFAQDALAMGLKLGFICSSDDHSGHPGKGPLVAVYADGFTREDILNALRARRCYGTTGARMIIDFTANDRPMGSELECRRPPLLCVQVHAPGQIERVDIVRNGKTCHTERPAATQTHCAFTYRDRELREEHVYYYVRVIQANGEMGWSSPVFVHYLGPAPRLTVQGVRVVRSASSHRPMAVEAVVKNTGERKADPAVVWFMVDRLPAVPVSRERPPVRSGIGGLMLRPGLQVWRWPVNHRAVNVFIRWGGDKTARDCSGSVRVIDALDYVWTPFHREPNDKYEEPEKGLIHWSTTAEAGSGDGLNLWVLVDPRKRTRVEIDYQRGGKRRPDEFFTRIGRVTKLPTEIDLVDYEPWRWIGEAKVPPLGPGEARRIRLGWQPPPAASGSVVWQIRTPSLRRVLASGRAAKL